MMLEVEQISYTAIITINLPGTDQPATASITLTPFDAIPTGSGKVKLLRDCTLADLNEFADALEAEVWAAHQERLLTDLAADEAAHVKITILNETGRPLSTEAEDWLAHAVILSAPAGKLETAELAVEKPAIEKPAVEEPAVEEGAGPYPEAGEEIPVTAESAEPDRAVGAEEMPAEAAAPAGEAAVAAEEMVGDDTEAEAAGTAVADTFPSLPAYAPVIEEEPAEAPLEAAPLQAEEEKPAMRIAGLRRPLGHPTSAAVDILINEPAFRDAQAHSLSSMDREVAGVLVGPMPEKQPDGRYVVHITDIIIAKHTKMHGASVTYTPESWRYIHDRLGERYPNEEALIVGWYHTHPGFGIFLSGMDLFIHQNFFTQIWHVALVLDPVARRSGFFCWERGQTEVKKYDFPWPQWVAGSW